MTKKFQFLIGKVETFETLEEAREEYMFQFLIGKVETGFMPR